LTVLEDYVIRIKPHDMGESNTQQQLLHLTLQALLNTSWICK